MSTAQFSIDVPIQGIAVVVFEQEQEQEQEQKQSYQQQQLPAVTMNYSLDSNFHPDIQTASIPAREYEQVQTITAVKDNILNSSTYFSSSILPDPIRSYIINYKILIWENIIEPYSKQGANFMEFFGGKIKYGHFHKNSLQKMNTGLCLDMISKLYIYI